mmetsp:Transcript_869/g.1114  ORF Transcript_869/g.1114 Transcript_869/m.1114 type:complete len:565 (+) Transcript_869:116-1810(+)
MKSTGVFFTIKVLMLIAFASVLGFSNAYICPPFSQHLALRSAGNSLPSLNHGKICTSSRSLGKSIREMVTPAAEESDGGKVNIQQNTAVLEKSTSEVDAEIADKDTIRKEHIPPGIRELLRFTLPTVLMLQAGPIMSIVDTAVVGRDSSLGLAALGPGTQLCDGLMYTFNFLGMATNIMVASAFAADNEEEVQKTVSIAFFLAVGAGALYTLLLQGFGERLLYMMVGKQSYKAVPLAWNFVKARCLSGIAIMLTMVGQASSLALKDSFIPLKIIVFNALTNLTGDILLVCKLGMGITGAAIATAASEVGGAFLMVSQVMKKFSKRLYPLMKIPSFADFKKVMKVGIPLLLMMMTRIWIFGALSYTVSSVGTASLGAFQVTLRIFLFFAMFGDSLSQAAQAYLPLYNLRSAIDPKTRKAKYAALGNLLKIALVAGSANAFFASLIPLKVPQLFTTDPLVITEMHKMVPMLSINLIVHALCLTLEGALISKKDTKFLAGFYLFNGSLLFAYLRKLKDIPFLAKHLTQAAWGGLCLYTCIRVFAFGGRYALKEMEDISEARKAAESS